MKQTIIIGNESFLVSPKAFKKIEAIIEDDLQMQSINQSIWESFNKTEQETYNNKLSENLRLPQEKSLLFSRNK